MNRLPRETFLIITSFLDFETRFQFACVCKSWHSIISTHNLYETVYIDRDHEKPIIFFEKNKIFGSTVKSLQVNTSGLVFKLFRQWPNYFPNLLNFSLASAEIDMFSSDYEEEYESDEECYEEEGKCFDTISNTFKKWGRLVSLSEFTKYVYTGSILRSGYYPDLTIIDLNFNIVPDHAIDVVMDNLLVGLQNVPSLKYLKLIVAKLTLKKLDLLHHNAPSIEGLILEDITLGEDTATTQDFIPQPATNLKRLEMQGNRYSFYENDDLSVADWLDYIARKYPSIETLKMNQFTPASIEYDSFMINIVNHCNQLKTFNVDMCHLSAAVLQAFDQTDIRLEKYSSQSQDMTQLRNLSLSNQRHSVYRLDLVIPIGNTDFVEILDQFTGLTTINTYPSSDIDYAAGKPLEVPINSFLKQHKLLEFLTLSSCIIYMNDEETQDGIRSVLDTFEMEKVTLRSQSVLDFIPNACPLLKVMILKARFEQAPRLTEMNFSNHSLVYMDVYIQGHAFIRLSQQGKIQWFKYEKEGRKIKYINIKEEEADQSNVLAINVHQVDRISIGVPRDPFVVV